MTASLPSLLISQLEKSFSVGGKAVRALQDISLSCPEGSFTALIGPSGCGKSTLLRIIAGLESGDSGKVLVGGSMPDVLRRRGALGVAFQDPALLPWRSVRRNVALPFDVLGHRPTNWRPRVDSLIRLVGLSAFADALPRQLSGGMRQRALIAIGLAARPKLLIADEPTSALDVTVQRKILDHLEGLTDQLGTAVLFITHDLGLAAERAEHLVVMYRGQVVESGPARKILADPQHPYTKRLVASAPSLASRRIQSAKERGERATELLAITHGDGVSPARQELIRVEHLTKVFELRGGGAGAAKEFKAVDDVSFTVRRGTTMALVGESGSGKSTVANIMLNLLQPTEGKIYFEGTDLHQLDRKGEFGFRRRVQPIFQNPYGSLDPMYSIFRTLEEPLRIHHVGDKKAREKRVRELLDMVALPASTMRRFPNELSGGQRQRIAVARALALEPDVIVCDEAVSALDVLVQAQILTLLNDLQAELGLTYLFITHDLAVVRQIADEVSVMQSGRIVEAATTDEVFDNPREEYTRELLNAIPGAHLDVFGAPPAA
ncbi:MAG: ABC transporter ATP-binding protein [Cellulomonas sp. 14-74-6]|nr:MAG: ABC transporter ATP-binding protein [Cellulomonas sp. 14-74-6]